METGAGITAGNGRVELRYETDQSEASAEQERDKTERGAAFQRRQGEWGAKARKKRRQVR